MESGHFNNKGKEVVDKGVESLVNEDTPRHMCDRFKFVIDVQLRCHHDETKGIDKADQGAQNP